MALSTNETDLRAPTTLDIFEEKLQKLESPRSLDGLSTEAPLSPLVSPSDGQKPQQTKVISFPSRVSKPAWDSFMAGTIKHAKGCWAHLESLSRHALEMKLDPQSGISLQSAIKNRIAARDAYVRGLHSKCHDVDLIMIELADSAAMLKRAVWSKWAPLCVVRERIRIRSTKSPQEQCQDAWQLALEVEEATLATAREELLDLLKETQHWMSLLSQAKRDMLDGLNRKRRVGKVDHTILLEGYGKGIHLAEECSFLPLKDAMTTMHRPDLSSGDDANEEAEFAAVQQTYAEVEKYITSAQSHMRVNRNTAQEKSRLCLAANAVTLTNMNSHIGGLQVCVKQLRDLISECERQIWRGGLAMNVAGCRLKQSADPIRRISRQYSARMHHPDQANLPNDRVYEKLDEHLDAVKTFVTSISSHMALTKEVMEDLKKTKRLLEQAMNMKQHALQVDSSCVKEKREWIKTSTLLLQ